MSYTVNSNKYDFNSNKNQAIKSKLVGNEVLVNMSSIVSEYFWKDQEWIDELYAHENASYYEFNDEQVSADEVESFKDWLESEVLTDYDDLVAAKKMLKSLLAIDSDYNDDLIGDLDEIIQEWEVALEDLQTEIDSEDYDDDVHDIWELYNDRLYNRIEEEHDKLIEALEDVKQVDFDGEFWSVTGFFGKELERFGAVVVDWCGHTIWARGGGGQAILLDHIVSEIAHSREILEGQKNQW